MGKWREGWWWGRGRGARPPALASPAPNDHPGPQKPKAARQVSALRVSLLASALSKTMAYHDGAGGASPAGEDADEAKAPTSVRVMHALDGDAAAVHKALAVDAGLVVMLVVKSISGFVIGKRAGSGGSMKGLEGVVPLDGPDLCPSLAHNDCATTNPSSLCARLGDDPGPAGYPAFAGGGRGGDFGRFAVRGCRLGGRVDGRGWARIRGAGRRAGGVRTGFAGRFFQDLRYGRPCSWEACVWMNGGAVLAAHDLARRPVPHLSSWPSPRPPVPVTA